MNVGRKGVNWSEEKRERTGGEGGGEKGGEGENFLQEI